MNLNDDKKRATASRKRTTSAGASGSMSRSRAAGTGRSNYSGARNTRSSASYGSAGSSAGRGTSSARRTSNKKRRPQHDYMKIAIGGVLLVLVITCVALAMKGIKGAGKGETAAETTVAEVELEKNVTVDGITITGMTKDQAKTEILKNYEWGMKVKYNEDTYDVQDLMSEKLNFLLEDIYSSDAPQETYALDTTGMDDEIQAEVTAMASKWDKPAKNGSISGFDKEAGSFIYSGEEKGVVIDQEKLNSDIQGALDAKQFKTTLTAEGKEVEPEVSEEEAKAKYKVIGTYTTTTTSSNNRNTNIRLASDCLNGLVLQPGEEFSFNKTTGNRTEARGYKAAGAYQNGEVVEEPGGGVCQVSSTLYNAVVFAGLTTTERHAHTFEPSYVTPGEDAMVSYDGYSGPDMKFVNNSKTAIAIRASFADRKLTISIVGIPILEEGVKLSMHSEKVAELDGPTPTYVEDATLQPGVEVVAKKGTSGSRWTTNLVTKKNGEVVSDEFFHNSTYKGHQATIKRNTSGKVEASTEETSSTVAMIGGEVVPTEELKPETTQTETIGSAGGPGETKTSSTTVAPTTAAQATSAASKTTTAAAAEQTVAPTTAAVTAPTAAPSTTAAAAGDALVVAPNPMGAGTDNSGQAGPGQ